MGMSFMTTLTVNELRMQHFDTLKRDDNLNSLSMGMVACTLVRRRSL